MQSLLFFYSRQSQCSVNTNAIDSINVTAYGRYLVSFPVGGNVVFVDPCVCLPDELHVPFPNGNKKTSQDAAIW